MHGLCKLLLNVRMRHTPVPLPSNNSSSNATLAAPNMSVASVTHAAAAPADGYISGATAPLLPTMGFSPDPCSSNSGPGNWARPRSMICSLPMPDVPSPPWLIITLSIFRSLCTMRAARNAPRFWNRSQASQKRDCRLRRLEVPLHSKGRGQVHR